MDIAEAASIADFVMELNRDRSAAYMAAESREARKEYEEKHSTLVLVFQCMDGRVDLSQITGVPPSSLMSFKNIGGVFDLGWGLLGRIVIDRMNSAISHNRKVLILATYHYAKGHSGRGCAGHNHDTDAAYRAACRVRIQCAHLFPGDDVYAVTAGIETDGDELQLHSCNDDVRLDVGALANSSETDIAHKLKDLYPDMGPALRRDLLPLVLGNRQHMQSMQGRVREDGALVHRESIVAVGTGYDWLQMPNKAIIIGPYAVRWQMAVVIAGRIALKNLQEGRIPADKGVLLMISAPFRIVGVAGVERRFAEERTRVLVEESLDILQKQLPELTPYLSVLTTVLDRETWLLRELNRIPALAID